MNKLNKSKEKIKKYIKQLNKIDFEMITEENIKQLNVLDNIMFNMDDEIEYLTDIIIMGGKIK